MDIKYLDIIDRCVKSEYIDANLEDEKRKDKNDPAPTLASEHPAAATAHAEAQQAHGAV